MVVSWELSVTAAEPNVSPIAQIDRLKRDIPRDRIRMSKSKPSRTVRRKIGADDHCVSLPEHFGYRVAIKGTVPELKRKATADRTRVHYGE